MSLILNLETSSKNCSVSLSSKGKLIDLIESAKNFKTLKKNSEIKETIVTLADSFSINNPLWAESLFGIIFMAFSFGLLHGLGFAEALSDIGIGNDQMLLSLLFFNIGIEFLIPLERINHSINIFFDLNWL